MYIILVVAIILIECTFLHKNAVLCTCHCITASLNYTPRNTNDSWNIPNGGHVISFAGV